MHKFARLFVCAACLAAAVSASAQQAKKPPKITLPGLAGIVLEQQIQLDDLSKKLNDAEARLTQAVEICKKKMEAAAVQVRQSPAPTPAVCDHSDLERQIKALRLENAKVKRRVLILERAMNELRAAHQRGEKHRKQLAEALAAVQREFPERIAGLSSAIAKLEVSDENTKKIIADLKVNMDEAARALKQYEPRIDKLETRADATDKAVTALERRNNDAFQRRIYFGVAAEAWAVRAGYAVGGGAHLQIPLAGGTCSVVLGGAAGWRKGNEAAYAAQLLGRCGRSVHVRFGGLALFGDSKAVGGTLGIGYARPFFTVFADIGPGGEKLGNEAFRITYMVKGGLGLRF